MARHICPFWIGYLLSCPLRRFIHEPNLILGGLIEPGMTALDVGPGMGFFSLPMARMVGREGKVIALEVQEKMLKTLRRRAGKAGFGARLVPRICPQNSLGLEDFAGKVDFALAFAVVHELPNVPVFFKEISQALKPGGRCLVAEPRGHTSSKGFEQTLAEAEKAHLIQIERPRVCGCYAAVLQKAG
jgi:ubiquinone/menaquinone biosynthesis C-methylase UbiE